MKKSAALAVLGACFLFAFPVEGRAADPAPTGKISGRVFNPATGDYVRNAEVRLEGTHQIAATENDGSFQFLQVAPGPAVLSELAVVDDLAAGRLVRVPVRGADLTRALHAVWPRGQLPVGPARDLLAIATAGSGR